MSSPKRKNRDVKTQLYQEKFGDIPIDYKERLAYLYDKLKLNENSAREIVQTRDAMINQLYFKQVKIILMEIPEGAPRPRFRIINRTNFANMAIANPNFVHVYSINAHEDSVYMKRMVDNELVQLNSLICTPVDITINTFSKTPSSYNRIQIYLSELGLIRPLSKPDWDNIEKKYSDMFNHNIWLDDIMVVDGHIHKYYSVLPRLEIDVSYMNMVYNKQQYNSIVNRTDYNDNFNLQYFGGNNNE